MATLVTGSAGFIGFHVAERLLARGEEVIGLDSLNDYYSVKLKRDRIAQLQRHHNAFRFVHGDFADYVALTEALAGIGIDRIVHLGAQAGVGYSLVNPQAYVRSNLMGQVNMLELA